MALNSGGVGAIYMQSGAQFNFINDTLANNSAGSNAFGSPSGGSGIWTQLSGAPHVTVANVIFANAANDNCGGGGILNSGHNMDTGLTCILTGTGSISNTPALLGPLAYNGGPTQTHLPLPGSPAIDQGDNAACALSGNRDQRNFLRPIAAFCDIGAVEQGPRPVPALDPTLSAA